VVTVLVDLGSVPVGQTVGLVLAQDPAPPPGKGEEFGKASPVGLVVLVVLFLATILLVRSMNKHLRKVPASFDASDATASDDTASDDTAADAPHGPAAPPSDVAVTPAAGPRSGDDPPDGATRA
jgi:hypothetical protein